MNQVSKEIKHRLIALDMVSEGYIDVNEIFNHKSLRYLSETDKSSIAEFVNQTIEMGYDDMEEYIDGLKQQNQTIDIKFFFNEKGEPSGYNISGLTNNSNAQLRLSLENLISEMEHKFSQDTLIKVMANDFEHIMND